MLERSWRLLPLLGVTQSVSYSVFFLFWILTTARLLDLYRTSKQKADHMKRQIHEKIVGMLGAYISMELSQ